MKTQTVRGEVVSSYESNGYRYITIRREVRTKKDSCVSIRYTRGLLEGVTRPWSEKMTRPKAIKLAERLNRDKRESVMWVFSVHTDREE